LYQLGTVYFTPSSWSSARGRAGSRDSVAIFIGLRSFVQVEPGGRGANLASASGDTPVSWNILNRLALM
jgi:hypothetical protein